MTLDETRDLAARMMRINGHSAPTLFDWHQRVGMGKGKRARSIWDYECQKCSRAIGIDSKPVIGGEAVFGAALKEKCE